MAETVVKTPFGDIPVVEADQSIYARRHDPVLWVLLPKDESDYSYDREPLSAFTAPEHARDEQEEDEHAPVLYLPADRMRAAHKFLDDFMTSKTLDAETESHLSALRALLKTIDD